MQKNHRNAIMVLIIIIILIILFTLKFTMHSDNFYNPDIYPLGEITENYGVIKAEIENAMIMTSKSSPSSQYIEWVEWPEKSLTNGASDRWNVIPLFAFGKWSKYSESFPETMKLVKNIPGLRTAGFSKLGPGTKLNPHQGWAALSNNVLRCHFGLIVPDNCRVFCNGEYRTQEVGKWIVFDDSKTHSAENNSLSDRVILLIDIDRPWWVSKGRSTISVSKELEDFLAKMG